MNTRLQWCSTLQFLCLFTSGPAGFLSVALAQEEAESIPGSNLDAARCEPMTGNVTLPSAEEDVLPPNR